MKLIFNAEALRPPVTGVGHYTYHLLEQFVGDDTIDDVHCFTGGGWLDGASQLAVTAAQLATEHGDAGAVARAVQGIRTGIGYIPGSKTLYDALMTRRFTRFANTLPGAVYHETNYILKPFDGPCVATVHDLSHVRHPEFHKPEIVAALNRQLPRSVARADHIIVDSDVVRDELLAHFNLPAERVTTVYAGFDDRYRPRSEQECAAVLAQLGLRYQKYVLMVATLEPRKGIDVLLEAWEELPAAIRDEYTLVLAGSSGWHNEAIMRKLHAMIAQGGVKYLGYADAQLLPQLFSAAAVFSYPSVYEGFGLPVLDAMASGVPAVCRAGTSMAEFAQGHCVLCETGAAEELAVQLTGLLVDTAERQAWGARGLKQAQRLTWARCAAQVRAIYAQLL